jgi:hypothetical protein
MKQNWCEKAYRVFVRGGGTFGDLVYKSSVMPTGNELTAIARAAADGTVPKVRARLDHFLCTFIDHEVSVIHDPRAQVIAVYRAVDGEGRTYWSYKVSFADEQVCAFTRQSFACCRSCVV